VRYPGLKDKREDRSSFYLDLTSFTWAEDFQRLGEEIHRNVGKFSYLKVYTNLVSYSGAGPGMYMVHCQKVQTIRHGEVRLYSTLVTGLQYMEG
jgi:hypothetical protein